MKLTSSSLSRSNSQKELVPFWWFFWLHIHINIMKWAKYKERKIVYSVEDYHVFYRFLKDCKLMRASPRRKSKILSAKQFYISSFSISLERKSFKFCPWQCKCWSFLHESSCCKNRRVFYINKKSSSRKPQKYSTSPQKLSRRKLWRFKYFLWIFLQSIFFVQFLQKDFTLNLMKKFNCWC